MTNQEYIKAIEMRHSRRAYKNRHLDEETKSVIREMVDAVNASTNLDFIFIDDATPAFRIFQGKFSMIAVCGPDSQKAMEEAGYYGESIVLQCVYHGLGTCWVSGTFNENKVYEMTRLPRNERLYCVIAIGYPKERENAVEKTMFKATHKKNKSYQDMFEVCDEKLSDVYAYAMKLVEMGPSAVNRRPVKFSYEKGVISARVEEPYSDQSIDFGIAKLHFILGCRAKGVNGRWTENNVFEEIKTQKIKFEKEEN
ncbi:MAG: nitroreductase family protein [Eubacterium sp.]|nr:nitroreductase family protein [Eubacterium sp.]MBR4242191.1 nitroreductase family protein [Eubacterium sp.]